MDVRELSALRRSGLVWASVMCLSTWQTHATQLYSCLEYVSHQEVTASYYICPLMLDSASMWPYYQVYDNRTNTDATNFSYVFNIAATVQSYPSNTLCYDNAARQSRNMPVGYCPSLAANGTCIKPLVPIVNETGSYQLAHHSDKCWRLHNGITQPTWEFLDCNDDGFCDPTKGVIITYRNGDYCQSEGRNREFRLILECSDKVDNYPDKEEEVFENPNCVYAMRLQTIYACPNGCETVNNRLCNGQGICEYDWTNEKSRCFCYDGYYGQDCSDTEDPNETTEYKDDDTGYITALVVVIILLVVVLAVLVYLFMRLHNISIDPAGTLARKAGLTRQRGGSAMLVSSDTSINNEAQQNIPL